jgi:hypothetical protein
MGFFLGSSELDHGSGGHYMANGPGKKGEDREQDIFLMSNKWTLF